MDAQFSARTAEHGNAPRGFFRASARQRPVNAPPDAVGQHKKGVRLAEALAVLKSLFCVIPMPFCHRSPVGIEVPGAIPVGPLLVTLLIREVPITRTLVHQVPMLPVPLTALTRVKNIVDTAGQKLALTTWRR